ncbi:MAG: F0F1 ATP synthase subunit delta [Candidatus Pacebacteria bacterium]|nr:F0F1 ATP synthase subunit delta [Candidatus Paceibacterota bacterium]MDD5752854.1 F0F1 ATP synthase subunit delta [Candidatus Paceibacterota bacterium]
MKKEKEVTILARSLYLSLKENPEKKQEIFSNLLKILEKKKELLFPILKKAENIYKKEEIAELVLALDFDKELKEELEIKIQDILKEKKEINYSLDESLLAGFRLKTKDIFIKASLKDVLIKMKKKYGLNRTV